AEACGFMDGYTTAKKEGFANERTHLCDRLNRLQGDFGQLVNKLQDELRFERDSGAGFEAPQIPRQVKVVAQASAAARISGRAPLLPVTKKHAVPVAATTATEGSADRRILIALAQNPAGITQRKLGILAGVTPGGSTWRRVMAHFRKESLVLEPGGDLFKISEFG